MKAITNIFIWIVLAVGISVAVLENTVLEEPMMFSGTDVAMWMMLYFCATLPTLKD